jgi:hypothetical protein
MAWRAVRFRQQQSLPTAEQGNATRRRGNPVVLASAERD